MRRALAVLVAAIPMGFVAPKPAGAQPGVSPRPDAVASALLAYDIVHVTVVYEPDEVHGTLAVILFGPPPPEWPDQIFRVAWATEPNRFSAVEVRWTGGEVRRTYDELLAQVGPRPAGFDRTTVTETLLRDAFRGFGEGFELMGRAVVMAVALACLAITAIVVSFVLAIGIGLRIRDARLRS